MAASPLRSAPQSQATSELAWPESLATTILQRVSADNDDYDLALGVAMILAPQGAAMSAPTHERLLKQIHAAAAHFDAHQLACLTRILEIAASPLASEPAPLKWADVMKLLTEVIKVDATSLAWRVAQDNSERLAAPFAAYHLLLRRALARLTRTPGALRACLPPNREEAMLDLAKVVHDALLLLHPPHRASLLSGDRDSQEEYEATAIIAHREDGGKLEYKVEWRGSSKATWVQADASVLPSRLVEAYHRTTPLSPKLRRLGDVAAARADPLRSIVEILVALVLGTLTALVSQCEEAGDQMTLSSLGVVLADTLSALPTATLQLRLLTALPPSPSLMVTLLKSHFVTPTPLSTPQEEADSVASLRAALAVHLNWRADDADVAMRQVRSRLRNAGGDSARSSGSAGPNELVLLALIHRVLVAASRNDSSRGGADAAARSAYDALSRTVRDAARRRDMDAVEEATVEQFLRQIELFLAPQR